jgi:hypothetical protein
MRMMMKVSIPVEPGNAAIANGTLASTMAGILNELKPEAAYFVAENGVRTGYLFLNMTENSQLPALAEPFFLAFNAAVSVTPAMSAQDLAAAGPGIAHSVKTYAPAK